MIPQTKKTKKLFSLIAPEDRQYDELSRAKLAKKNKLQQFFSQIFVKTKKNVEYSLKKSKKFCQPLAWFKP